MSSMKKKIYISLAYALLLTVVLPILSPLLTAQALYEEITYGKEPQVQKPSSGEITPQPPATLVLKKPVAGILEKLDPKLLDKNYLSLYKEKRKTLYGIKQEGAANTVEVIVKTSDVGKLLSNLQKRGLASYVEVKETIEPLKLVVLKITTENDNEYRRVLLGLASLSDTESVWLNDIYNITLFDTRAALEIIGLYRDLGINGTGIRVAIIDTGVEDEHPELAGKIVAWSDFINYKPEPYDDAGHGTFVAGIIAAQGVSPWLNGEGLWHSVNFDSSDEFNYPGIANLTYEIDVSSYAGHDINISFYHRYWIEDGYDYGYVKYRFDTDSSWTTLDSFTGDGFSPETKQYTLTVPSGASKLYLSFIYEPNSSVQRGGWWLDDIKVYDATDATKVIFYDDVEGSMPANVIESRLWSRTCSRLRGVAPGVDIMAAKVCSASGGCPIDAIINGIVWATLGPDGEPNTGDEADIISMSLGGPAYSYDILMQTVDWAAYNYSVIFVVAAGNEGPGYYTVASPGAAHGAIAVGASTKVNTIASFSSWGPSPVDRWVKPDIVAPGRHIVSIIAAEPYGLPPGSYLVAIGSGTSFSTPHVSAIAALIKQVHPDWGPEEVRAALVSTTLIETVEPSGYTDYTINPYIVGGGLVDPVRAVATEFLPIPALVSFGSLWPLSLPLTLEENITLTNYATTSVEASISQVELYDIYGNDYSSWIISPSVGDVFEVLGGSKTNMSLKVYVPRDAPQDTLYWGRIVLNVDGNSYQVLFGFYVMKPIKISGYVEDYLYGGGIADAEIRVYSPGFSTLYSTNISLSDGYYEILAPANTYLRIVAVKDGYYKYISPALQFSSNATYDIEMTKRFGFYPLQLLVVKDAVYGLGDFSTESLPDVTIFTKFNGTNGIIMRVWDNSVQGLAADAILSGDFVAVAWLSAGVWPPVADEVDYSALIRFASTPGRGVLLEGGDLGWIHDGDALMTNVAHATFIFDMSPGYYEIYLLKPWHILGCCLPSTLEIDSSRELPGSYGYPDAVEPLEDAYAIAEWNIGNKSIVVHNGFEYSDADTAYIAFPVASILNSTALDTLVQNTLVWLLDHEPPIVPEDAVVNISLQYIGGGQVEATIKWTPFNDMTPSLHYEIIANDTVLATVSGTTEATVTLSEDSLYMLSIKAYDCKNRTASIDLVVYVPPHGTQGGFVYYRMSDKYTGVYQNTDVTYEFDISGAAATQLVLLSTKDSVVDEKARLPEPYIPVRHMDVRLFNSSNVNKLVIEVPYKENALLFKEDTIKVFWLDEKEGKWKEASNYTVDTDANKVTIVFTKNTSPSTKDLEGTPIILAALPAIVGGNAVLEQRFDTLSFLLMALAALVPLAIAAIMRRYK